MKADRHRHFGMPADTFPLAGEIEQCVALSHTEGACKTFFPPRRNKPVAAEFYSERMTLRLKLALFP
jgi:hypothetical protein